MTLQDEMKKRRTFAIISHPDAGKTTMTEKLLLYGNLIRSAGTVKGKKSGKFATSDWMEIEKQRGISVTSSVMNFPYQGHQINILDTPGHEDFSEDTYRTLTAVDSVVMIIDSTKGIEAQTLKLFKVCRMRGIPIFTFINKLDREGKDPFELLDEIEEVLDIQTCPMNWPAGMGKRFLGIFNRQKEEFVRYNGDEEETIIPYTELHAHSDLTENAMFQDAKEELALLDEAGDNFSLDDVLAGEQTPVFFGSALAPFGVETFFNTFVSMAPAPGPRKSTEGVVSPDHPEFSGFIFKIQANMNPAHRDRIAFVRVCSGKFERGMEVKLSRTGKTIKLAQSQQFVASSRGTVEEAYAGDIIGIYDPNIYRIGDTLVTGKDKFEYDELPQFPPELFKKVTAKNVMKAKQFKKGLEQLVQEGAIQLFKRHRTESYILGAVGELQYEVFQYRMKNEYNVEVMLESIGERIPRWLQAEQIDESLFDEGNLLVRDREENHLVLFRNEFALNWFQEKHPDMKLIDLFEVNSYDQTT
ncbi:peptide chain release factor 3 [Virgibacillus halodenitrificans]|jgi:peptide chain release factor 3|uniref:Peptide chain release factor 3 n=1 Tax=Virgibacillus halodenitrificans TaxID=1482 RepID=A0ABR7VU78_VIRHA|nr:peptide chain release factor 3 [Virgibacillus halodenitrificans]MBD1224508.1 peptide chain release factor 3 [Virgibacillus halodenitrificans]MCG1029000.1 peptide chain release factor 3 [Virgibacillus halodenitrificans]MYL45101.1 peptide chain release factor 3 [Virgibacillus halodenitrificans]WHX27854.1 peptide chain release factor 3 [Virgibacillus halodenitrificans]